MLIIRYKTCKGLIEKKSSTEKHFKSHIVKALLLFRCNKYRFPFSYFFFISSHSLGQCIPMRTHYLTVLIKEKHI